MVCKVQVDDKDSNVYSSVLDVSDVLFNFAMNNYMNKWKAWNTKEDTWMDTTTMILNFNLLHRLMVLESLLKSQTRWDEVSSDMDGFGILLILRDVTHTYDSPVQSKLSYVKTSLECFL